MAEVEGPLPPIEHPRDEDSHGTVLLVYVLYIAFFMSAGISLLIGVIVAYVYRDDAAVWLQSHYQLQIRTFWMSLLYVGLGSLLKFLIVGKFILIFWLVWFLVRCIKGIRHLNRREPYPNPTAWFF